jgi:hypothetical protein
VISEEIDEGEVKASPIDEHTRAQQEQFTEFWTDPCWSEKAES